MRKLKSDKFRISYMALYRPNGELASVLRYGDPRKRAMESFIRIGSGFKAQPISPRQAKRLAASGIKVDKNVS